MECTLYFQLSCKVKKKTTNAYQYIHFYDNVFLGKQQECEKLQSVFYKEEYTAWPDDPPASKQWPWGGYLPEGVQEEWGEGEGCK